MTRRAPCGLQAPVRQVARHQVKGDEALLAQVQASTDRGAIVRLGWYGGPRIDIMRNGSQFLVREPGGIPLATTESAAEAVEAADRYVKREVEDPDKPWGAA